MNKMPNFLVTQEKYAKNNIEIRVKDHRIYNVIDKRIIFFLKKVSKILSASSIIIFTFFLLKNEFRSMLYSFKKIYRTATSKI